MRLDINDRKGNSAFSERFNYALDLRKYPPIGKGRIYFIQEAFSLSRAGANKWVHGKAIPHKSMRQKISEKLGINLHWLETGEGDPLALSDNRFDVSRSVVQIPLLTMADIKNIPEDKTDFQKIVVSHLPEYVFAVTFSGNSMLPKFQDGSVLIVDPKKMVSDGDYVLADVNQMPEAVLRQYVVGSRGAYLVSLNPKFEPIFFSGNDKLIGKVIEVRINLADE